MSLKQYHSCVFRCPASDTCSALNALYCKMEDCKFYKDKVNYYLDMNRFPRLREIQEGSNNHEF